MSEVDQAALPLWSSNEPAQDYTPMFAVGEHVRYIDDDTWRGTVVQVVKYEPTGRNHFWVVWSVGAPGGPHEHTAAELARAPKLSADARRTERQAEYLARGLHPLTAALGYPIKLDAEAAPADDRAAHGKRCGTCFFRRAFQYHNRTYAKCIQGYDGEIWPRATHGAGTDVRAWWPACVDHKPKAVAS